MLRRRRHLEDDNHEAWAIPYGDLVTLLLAFFVVMYSMSSVNDGKYRVLSNSLNAAFHGTPHSPRPIPTGPTQLAPIANALPLAQVDRMVAAGLPEQGALLYTVTPISSVADNASSQLPTQSATAANGPAALAATRMGRSPSLPAVGAAAVSESAVRAAQAAQAANAQLGQVAANVSSALARLVASGRVHVERFGNWVTIDISTDILFPSGVARLSPAAVSVLQRLAAVLKPWPNAIRVEGHTDDRPIDTPEFPSNWELSAARAASVVHLFVDRGIAPGRLAVLGFAQYRPLQSNATATGRRANRRVEIVVLGPDAAPEDGF